MATDQETIAWLVPTARGTYAEKTTSMPENSFRAVSPSSSPLLSSRLTNLTPDTTTTPRPKALRLAFDQPPKRPGSFVLGTDPSCCDVVLPPLPGIAPQHCAIRFDGEARLVLEDFSAAGSQVWYDWECVGDRTDYTWLLSGGRSKAFPDAVRRITIDIQGVRMQLVANDHSADWDAYTARVDDFCRQPDGAQGLSTGWDRASVAPVVPLFSSAPLFQHIFVKSLGDQLVSEMYLWNLARPWEPMVRMASA